MLIICTSMLFLALVVTIARRMGIERVIRRANKTLSEMEQSEERRKRITENPFFADISTGHQRKSFIDSISKARKTNCGSESVFTHISLAEGQPGIYTIHYFNVDLSLLQRFKTCVDTVEKDRLRHKMLCELLCSSANANSLIAELGTAFIDSFLHCLQGLSFDPLGDGSSYIYEMPIELLDQNIPIQQGEPQKGKSVSAFMAEHRQITLVCVFAFLSLAVAAVCAFFSDSFYYSGIAHYRRFVELFGAIYAEPQHKWPIVFTSLVLLFAVVGIHLLMIVIYRGLFPSRTMAQIIGLVIHRCSFFILVTGILMLHYLSCDFTGDRWYLLNYIYQCDIFYQIQAIYFYLHEIMPYFLCGTVLWSAIAWSCFSQRTRGIFLVVIATLVLLVGLFFLVFDLWFQPWAIIPIILPILITSGGIFSVSHTINKKRRKRREVHERNTTRGQS